MAAIKYRGPNAVTNFDISRYADKLKKFQQKAQPEIPKSSTEARVHEQQDHERCIQEEKPAVGTMLSDNTTAESQHDHKQHLQQEEPAEEPKVLEIITTESQQIVMMDPADDQEDPWNLCLDTGFNSLPVSDLPFEKPTELPDLFADTGFEDSIDFIFGALFDVNEVNLKDASGRTAIEIDTNSLGTKEEKEPEATTSSSSSLSTITIGR